MAVAVINTAETPEQLVQPVNAEVARQVGGKVRQA